MFEIHVFGTTAVHAPERLLTLAELPGGRPRHLLEVLALARNTVVGRPRLVEHLWAGRPPPQAVAALDAFASELRRTLQPGVGHPDSVVRVAAGGYRLDGAVVRLDLDLFDAAVARARSVTPAEALPCWQYASDLTERRVLEHEPDAEWALAAREDYRRRGVEATVGGAEAALTTGRVDDAIRLARRAVRRDPLSEDGWQLLIEAYGCAARPAEAAAAAAGCLEAMARSFGVYPSPRTRRLLGIALGGVAAAASRPVPIVPARRAVVAAVR